MCWNRRFALWLRSWQICSNCKMSSCLVILKLLCNCVCVLRSALCVVVITFVVNWWGIHKTRLDPNQKYLHVSKDMIFFCAKEFYCCPKHQRVSPPGSCSGTIDMFYHDVREKLDLVFSTNFHTITCPSSISVLKIIADMTEKDSSKHTDVRSTQCTSSTMQLWITQTISRKVKNRGAKWFPRSN